MRNVAVALAASLVLALAGCGSEDEVDADAPQAEPDVEDCGSYESLNAPPQEGEAEKNRCLLDAFEAGREAKLVVTLATVEGDPLVHYFTVTESGQLEVLVDSTKDKFGSGSWHALTCTGLDEQRGRLSWTGCAETDVPSDLPQTNPQQPS
jgi:hypothetical protein